MSNIVYVSIFLAALCVVRFVIAVATGDRAAVWAVVPLAWAALAIGCVGASGCEGCDGLPPVADGGVDAPVPDARPDAPPPKLLNVTIYIGPDEPDSYVAIGFWVNCPAGAPDGPHDGVIEHSFSDGSVFHTETFSWTCAFNIRTVAIFNVPCGRKVFGRAAIADPVSGLDVVELTDTMLTVECVP